MLSPALPSLVYAVTLFVSAFLLFLVQPLIAKMLLPRFGGTPAVWNTCMVFFQAALLAGYAYAHAATARLGARRQAALHVVLLLLPLLALPFALPAGGAASVSHPIVVLLGLLTATVGLPFFVVSTSAPLLQRWFASTGHPSARDPYFLYTASNAGSLLALFVYPFVIERRLRLPEQAGLWAGGYAVLALLTLTCAVVLWRAPTPTAAAKHVRPKPAAEPAPPTARRRLRWVVSAFVPSSLMLGVTAYFSADIAALPLIWVVPLALYLLTFILAFAGLPGWVARALPRLVPLVVLVEVFLILVEVPHPSLIWGFVVVHLLAFFTTALYCHGELARDRPDVRHLTEFYLWVSVGGFLGGLFNGVAAPTLFPLIVEYPLVVVLACFLAPPAAGDRPPRSAVVTVALPLGFGLLAGFLMVIWHTFSLTLGLVIPGVVLFPLVLVCYGLALWLSGLPLRFGLGAGVIMAFVVLDTSTQTRAGRVIHRERNFFGVLRVVLNAPDGYIQLLHGSTIHGKQRVDEAGRPVRGCEPLTYYYPTGPIGQVFAVRHEAADTSPVALIGLGAGALAYYGRPGQDVTFYEIDPAVERIARDTRYFTFLADSPARVDVRLGDARLALAGAADGRYGLIVVDAFSSDAIPVHLITREAVRLYLSKLSDHGLLAFHISNRYLNLEPLMANLAHDARLVAYVQEDLALKPEERAKGKDVSVWVVMGRRNEEFAPLVKKGAAEGPGAWYRISAEPSPPVWTDDFSNLLDVLRW